MSRRAGISWAGVFGWISSLVILAAVVVGFILAGSPIDARNRATDRQRLEDLATISNMVKEYYDAHKSLPKNLSECKIPTYRRSSVLQDPVTAEPYRYRIIDANHYELGAVFATDTRTRKDLMAYGDEQFMRHPKGLKTASFEVKKKSSGAEPSGGSP